MKNILTFIALISLTIFTACSNQKMEDDFAPTNEETSNVFSIDRTNSFGNLNANIAKASFKINNESSIVNEGDVLLLSNNSINAIAYHWDFGNGDTSIEAQPTYQYEIHGNRIVTLTITDASGKTHQTSNEVLVLCVFGGIDHNQ
ncbi:MAG: PKD domain-containing protein [Saprospiraceae bacterium]